MSPGTGSKGIAEKGEGDIGVVGVPSASAVRSVARQFRDSGESGIGDDAIFVATGGGLGDDTIAENDTSSVLRVLGTIIGAVTGPVSIDGARVPSS